MEVLDIYKSQFSGFHDMMKYRVREILLVSNSYDAFVLEEDGRLSEKIFSEYLDMNLQFVPRIRRVSSAEEAFSAMKERTYDLIITMARISDMDPLEFGKRIKEMYPGKPVLMLTYDTLNSELLKQIRETKHIDKVFYWSGNNKILLAIIKYVEDLGNAENDCGEGVQVILVVEDSPWAYSQFLPTVYTEIMKQTSYLISKGVNNLHRLLRMRARPKILLAETYEEAVAIFNRYRNNMLGVISDMGYQKDGVLNPEAGLHLAHKIKEEIHYLPFLIQSNQRNNEKIVQENGISFINKNSPSMNLELSTYILENYGFGDFIFRNPDGSIIARASTIDEFEEIIRILPEESLLYHARRYHFSTWFKARTEFECAEQMRSMDVSDFSGSQELREYILAIIQMYFRYIQQGVITDFGQAKFDMDSSLIKLGSGSLGGKGRGIAFFNYLFSQTDVFKKYKNIRIKTPKTFVICSEVFEEFLEINNLQEMAVLTDDEQVIAERFLSAQLPPKIESELMMLLEKITHPLAIRSSSILEDSQVLPFAGIYSTFLLPNNHENPAIRLKQLLDAVKLVYASVFYQSPKRYIKNAELRIEEEKMAVLIQELVGERHGDIFYPVISGVAQSYNFYPISYMKPDRGIVSLALGFGRAVVDGEQVYRFSPAYPKINPDFSSPADFLKKSQNQFYALNLAGRSVDISADPGCTYGKYDLERAEKDGTLRYIGSTYSRENDNISDTLSIPGLRLVSFAPVLKYGLIPLAGIIKEFFELGRNAFSSEIEMEFAVNIPAGRDEESEFYFLQIRPLISGRELQEVKISYPDNQIICKSRHTIGNGIFQDICDIVYIDPARFELSNSKAIAAEISELNQLMLNEERKYILIGFGRLGSSDPWLGIPLAWAQMSQAKVVVEADLENLQVEPSLGSHFHHNLVSLRMGYLHIGHGDDCESVDWAWLNAAPLYKQAGCVRLARLEKPLTVIIDGRTCKGVILKSQE